MEGTVKELAMLAFYGSRQCCGFVIRHFFLESKHVSDYWAVSYDIAMRTLHSGIHGPGLALLLCVPRPRGGFWRI